MLFFSVENRGIIYSRGPSSQPIHPRFFNSAAIYVDPEPQKRSNTRSPSFEVISITRPNNLSDCSFETFDAYVLNASDEVSQSKHR